MSHAHCTLFGVQSWLVTRVVPAPFTMAMRDLSLASETTASATAEFVRSVIMSTPWRSIHSRARLDAMSGLFWWSPCTTSIGLPSTLPPKSSTAMRTAVTEPAPERSDSAPPMSVSTPIFTTSPDTVPWAVASKETEQNAAASANCSGLRNIGFLRGRVMVMGNADASYDVPGEAAVDADVLAGHVARKA